MRRRLVFLFAVLALSGCATGFSEPPVELKTPFASAPPVYSLDVLLNESGVSIVGVRPYDSMNAGLKPVSSGTPDSLHWVIRAEDGKVLAQGHVRDPRTGLVERDVEGHGAALVRTESALFQLDVPTNQGRLELYENQNSRK